MARSLVNELAIGVDVGGTFTDVVCGNSERTWRAKAPTVADDIGQGVIDGCQLLAAQMNLSLGEFFSQVKRFGLGTTAVTNALTAKEGATVGLITTQGFEGLALNARGDRIQVDGWLEVPWVPVNAARIAGVAERLDHQGTVLQSLNENDVLQAVKTLVTEQGVNALAISFLWSYLNPVHEQRARKVIEHHFPSLPLFCGSELQPVMREYERTSSAIMNAFCASALGGIEKLSGDLKTAGLKVPLLILQASGGTATLGEVKRSPVSLAASGPAAGVVAAAEIASAYGINNAVTADMGGTSLDVAIVKDAAPVRSNRGKLHGVLIAQSHVAVESIGSGGGSIAWSDSRNMLRVGPQSARSYPGPACYDRGGQEPTITDAMLLLGYLDPQKFLGGTMALNLDASKQACAALGQKLGLNAMETAWAIREIALADMTNAVRSRLATSGLGVSELSGIAFGGSGPLVMMPLLQAVGVKHLLVPQLASVLSAFGAASADLRVERTASINATYPIDEKAIADQVIALKQKIETDLHDSTATRGAQRIQFEASMRFYRQTTELAIPVDESVDAKKLKVDFISHYENIYGVGTVVQNANIEIVTIKAIGLRKVARASLSKSTELQSGSFSGATTTRQVRTGRNQTLSVPVYDAQSIPEDYDIVGPALIDAPDNTLWVPADCHAQVDAFRTFSLNSTH